MTALPAENSLDLAVLQAVDRAIADLRRGAVILLVGPHESAGLIQAAETADPDTIDYVIPGNDDAIRSIKLFCTKISDA